MDSDSTEVIPSPVVVAPSQYWDGVDGQWSSFALTVGEPSQNARVLVSTNSPQTMIVLPVGCSSMAMQPVPLDCANSRGGIFEPNASKTWDDQGYFGINYNGVGFEANLGYTQNALYGLETVGIGYSDTGLTLRNQTVAAFATPSPFYLGIFGLGTQPVNYTNIGNFSAPSFFTSLRAQERIPSLSWSYTAGAKYRLKAGQYAQLIFGGFDNSRFKANQATFSLAPDSTRDIVVAIQAITYTGDVQSSILSSPTYAFIESTDPNFWLPEATCKEFEKAFGLSLDKSTGLYLINSTHYSTLKASDAQITFSLANSLSGGDIVNIVFPVNAFPLQAKYPFTENDTYYFPLRKADNDTQTTLGRAFLQEAYLTVDYERGNFSISQCLWVDGAAPDISSIMPPSSSVNDPTLIPSAASSKAQAKSNSQLSTAAIVGITICVAIALVSSLALAYFLLKRRRRPVSKVPTEDINLNTIPDDKDEVTLASPAFPAPVYRKYENESTLYTAEIPRIELATTGEEIYQLPERHNQEGDYSTVAREMRAAKTAEAPGIYHLYELQGDTPDPLELDDEASRRTLSPKLSVECLSPKTIETTTSSPRLPSPMSPLSPFSDWSGR